MNITRFEERFLRTVHGLTSAPLTVLAIVASAGWDVYIVQSRGNLGALEAVVAGISAGLYTALAFLIPAEIWGARRRLWQRVLASVGAIGIGVGYGCWCARHLAGEDAFFGIFMMLAMLSLTALLAGHREERLGAWVEHLWLNGLLVIISAHVLDLGISAAIAAIGQLFGLKIAFETYIYTYIFFCGLLLPLWWRGSLPSLERVTPHPLSHLPMMAVRFVARPLLLVYFLILWVYGLRILVQHSLPDGWVAFPVLVCVVLAEAEHLLSWNEPEGFVRRRGRRIFHALLLPLLALLVISVSRRVSDYGWTLPRVCLAALAAWAILSSVWMVSGKRRSPALPVAGIGIISLLLLLPGVGAASISQASQTARLEALTALYRKNPDRKTWEEITSVNSYLKRYHGVRRRLSDDVSAAGTDDDEDVTSNIMWNLHSSSADVAMPAGRTVRYLNAVRACPDASTVLCVPLNAGDTVRFQLADSLASWREGAPERPPVLHGPRADIAIFGIEGACRLRPEADGACVTGRGIVNIDSAEVLVVGR